MRHPRQSSWVTDRLQKATAACPGARGNGRSVADNIKPHLPVRGFGFQIGFALGEFFVELERHAVRALGRAVGVDCLANEVDRLHHLEHADIEPVPTVAQHGRVGHRRVDMIARIVPVLLHDHLKSVAIVHFGVLALRRRAAGRGPHRCRAARAPCSHSRWPFRARGCQYWHSGAQKNRVGR